MKRGEARMQLEYLLYHIFQQDYKRFSAAEKRKVRWDKKQKRIIFR